MAVDPRSPFEAEVDEPPPEFKGGIWVWGGTDEAIGPAELHELGLCDVAECDWCAEEAEEGGEEEDGARPDDHDEG